MMECDGGMWQRQLIWFPSVSHSVVSNYLWPPWTVAHQSPLSMGFSRQEYWSWLPFPSPGDLPDPRIKLGSPAMQGDSFFFFSFIFISWRLITWQYCSGFCHTLTWISHGFTCIPHPDPHSHLPHKGRFVMIWAIREAHCNFQRWLLLNRTFNIE